MVDWTCKKSSTNQSINQQEGKRGSLKAAQRRTVKSHAALLKFIEEAGSGQAEDFVAALHKVLRLNEKKKDPMLSVGVTLWRSNKQGKRWIIAVEELGPGTLWLEEVNNRTEFAASLVNANSEVWTKLCVEKDKQSQQAKLVLCCSLMSPKFAVE